jgi:hypothetical protein
MGKQRSRYVAPAIFWDTLIVPALLALYWYRFKAELPVAAGLALYAGMGAVLLAIVVALARARARRAPGAAPLVATDLDGSAAPSDQREPSVDPVERRLGGNA